MNNEGFLIYEFQIFFQSKIFPAQMNSLINLKSIDFKGKGSGFALGMYECVFLYIRDPEIPNWNGISGASYCQKFPINCQFYIRKQQQQLFFRCSPYTKSQLGLHGRVDIFL